MIRLDLGVKTDPVLYRYSYEWLFRLMKEEGVRYVQLGSSFEFYSLDKSWFIDLRKAAEAEGLQVRSVFTSHRELGGFFRIDRRFHDVARRMCERLLQIGSWVGADFVGWNPGAILRDELDRKEEGLDNFHRYLPALAAQAAELGLKGICLEPMSCLAEPPSTPDEIEMMMQRAEFERPEGSSHVYLCGDISHGVADEQMQVVHDNWELFRMQSPWMAEFHFKNTDKIFGSTFGFGEAEKARGIVDLWKFKALIKECTGTFPNSSLTGYLELPGPKLGRDYTDILLEGQLRESLRAIKAVFSEGY